MASPARIKIMTALVLLVVFGAGLAVGMVVDRTAVAAVAPEGTVSTVEEEEPQRRTPMYEQVGPSDEQMVLIDSIVKEYRAEMKSLRETSRAAWEAEERALVHSTREAIKGVFTPEQAARYDSLVVEYDRQRAERREAERRGSDGSGDRD